MKIFEVSNDCNVTIELSRDFKMVELTSQVVKILEDGILIKVLTFQDRILNLDFSKFIISIIVEDKPLPLKFFDVKITLCKIDNEYFHKVVSNKDGKTINRRENFRVFIGEEGLLYVKDNKIGKEVIIKDVSMGGFAIISTTEIDLLNEKVRIEYEDNQTKVILQGIVVRQYKITDNKIIYGCQLTKEPKGLNNYINRKQLKHKN